MAEHEDLRKRRDFDKHKEPEERLVSCETAPGVEPQPVLPRDVFLNKFTYYLYFLVRSPFFRISLVLFGSSLFFTITVSSEDWTFPICAVLSCLTGFAFVVSFFAAALQLSGIDVSRGFGLEQKMRFMVEIRDIKPGMDMPKWDIVAGRMNKYLFEAKYYPHKCAFYDGKLCHDGFKEVYLLPRKDAFDVTPLNDSIYGENGGFDYFKRQVSKDYYNSADEYLAKVHEESLKSRIPKA